MDCRTQPFVNVIGFVKDYQPPISTRGTGKYSNLTITLLLVICAHTWPDFKCAIQIKDHSVQYQSYGIKVSIFWPLAKMPRIYGVSDVILIRKAKVRSSYDPPGNSQLKFQQLQLYHGEVSLIANHNSEFHVLIASQIPKTPLTTSHVTNWTSKAIGTTAPWQSYPPAQCHIPTADETNYVILANTQISELALPSSEDFQEKSMQAMTVKQKFSLLKDIKPESYVDILGQVVKVLDHSSDRVTMYLSDYTANALFYKQVWAEGQARTEICLSN
jgi:protection-of-telomeres protein 1